MKDEVGEGTEGGEMTRKTYILWCEILDEFRRITEEIYDIIASHPGIDFGDPIAERIRQLGRDMEPPVEPSKPLPESLEDFQTG